MSTTGSSPQRSYFTTLARAWRLRCPQCGKSKLFANLFRMNPACPECGLKYQREPGYFLGSIYVNYGLTALLVTIFYFTLFFTGWVHPQTALWMVAGFAVIFPLWFFRYARSIWLGFDHYWDPLPAEKRTEPREPVAR